MNRDPTICFTRIPTRFGPLLIAGGAGGLVRINFQEGAHPLTPELLWVEDPAPDRGPLAEAARQLAAYFAGELREFSLPVAPEGTAFQRSVWRALQGIPYGRTIPYGELARRIGKPKGARAVGAANGANP